LGGGWARVSIYQHDRACLARQRCSAQGAYARTQSRRRVASLGDGEIGKSWRRWKNQKTFDFPSSFSHSIFQPKPLMIINVFGPVIESSARKILIRRRQYQIAAGTR
jgi:hypothetical protein